MITELVSVEETYIYAGGEFAPPAIASIGELAVDAKRLFDLRANVTDEDCGDYRQCWMKASPTPGCGARITLSDGQDERVLLAQCPTGTVGPYTACAQRVLDAIVMRLESTGHGQEYDGIA